MNRKDRRANKTLMTTAGNDPFAAVYLEAVQYHRAGNLSEAEKRYRKILELNPQHAESLHMLGVMAFDVNRDEIAESLVRKAIVIQNKNPAFYLTLGNILKRSEKYEEAIVNYNRAVTLKPNFAGGFNNIGLAYLEMDRSTDALNAFKKAYAIDPKNPHHANNIGYALQKLERIDEAIKYYRLALSVDPNFVDAINNLGNNYTHRGKYDDAIPLFREALKSHPHSPKILFDLGHALYNAGHQDESLSYFRRAIALDPTAGAYDILLMGMIYAASVTPQDLADTARDYGTRFADPVLRQRPLIRDLDRNRKLRIGYVSPDFRAHAVNYFFEPLLTLHDKNNFETFAYSHELGHDHVTGRLKQKFDHWRNIEKLDDDQAADLIEADNIDILIDLAGHTGANRLLVFARKPAPVQVTWLGYPATTGLKAIDYRITDHYAEPVGLTEHLNVETLWRLPEFFCCYQAHENSPAVIDHPPFEDNGYITFGCFNNFFKVTNPVLESWVKVLREVEDSRLLLEINKANNPQYLSRITERLKYFGIPLDRTTIEPRKPENQFVLYNKIDLALDPFPCVGGTTSMDAMWMGTPFVTLAGDHFTSRMGVSILTNAGLPELVAQNTEDYTNMIIDLAKDRERLKKIRHNLRARVMASPLMDQKLFVTNMEDTYRQMWEKYCAQKQTP